jgi:hypothetical protein
MYPPIFTNKSNQNKNKTYKKENNKSLSRGVKQKNINKQINK